MKTKLAICVAVSVVLAGCAGPAREAIPVVDAGSPLNKAAQQKPVVDVAAPMVQQDAERPSLPIQEEDTEFMESWQEVGSAENMEVAEQTLIANNGQASAAVQSSAPVQELLRMAQQYQSKGDLNSAATSLERAQRIAPRDPQVLYRLAEVRLAQGDAREAEQLAQRGLSLSSGQAGLQAGLWDLIADARKQLGDTQGEEQARANARVEL